MRSSDERMEMKRDHDMELEDELNHLDIIERPIDLSVQKEYQVLSDSIDFENANYEEILTEADKLFVPGTAIEEKKRILLLLAHLGTMESAKILEKYSKTSEGTLNDWAILALKECRMFLESVFLKEEGGFISTGLGGQGKKLRYYFIVSAREDRSFTGAGRNTIEEGFKKSGGKYGSEIEEINFGTDYSMMKVLVPMDVAVGRVIEEGIRQCNKMGEVLLGDYYVTNTKRPTKGEISSYLRDIRRKGR